eukprot:RCo041873
MVIVLLVAQQLLVLLQSHFGLLETTVELQLLFTVLRGGAVGHLLGLQELHNLFREDLADVLLEVEDQGWGLVLLPQSCQEMHQVLPKPLLRVHLDPFYGPLVGHRLLLGLLLVHTLPFFPRHLSSLLLTLPGWLPSGCGTVGTAAATFGDRILGKADLALRLLLLDRGSRGGGRRRWGRCSNQGHYPGKGRLEGLPQAQQGLLAQRLQGGCLGPPADLILDQLLVTPSCALTDLPGGREVHVWRELLQRGAGLGILPRNLSHDVVEMHALPGHKRGVAREAILCQPFHGQASAGMNREEVVALEGGLSALGLAGVPQAHCLHGGGQVEVFLQVGPPGDLGDLLPVGHLVHDVVVAMVIRRVLLL